MSPLKSTVTKNQPKYIEPVHIITKDQSLLNFKFNEIWQYRDLLVLLVRRDFVSVYKQTILGPIWFFIQPIFTSLIFTIIFGRLAGISTDGIPPMLFYLAGNMMWSYFAESLKKTATIFKDNQNLFGKVYFPRLISPLSVVISNLMKFAIQFLLFVAFYGYFISKGMPFNMQWQVALFPLLIILMSGLALGFGIIITSLTTKYRDLVFLLEFGVQLAMYATPVIYPLSTIPEKYRTLAVLNPMASIIETFKVGFLGQGTFSWWHLGYTSIFTIVLLLVGILIFNRTERNFMDTV